MPLKSMTVYSSPVMLEQESNEGYPALERLVRDRAAAAKGKPLFRTDAEGLFDLFLNNLPPERRQHYNCRACRTFVERFGGLATIGKNGEIVPVIAAVAGPGEDDLPVFFRYAWVAMWQRVRRAKVTGVFLSSDQVWGTPLAGGWSHLSCPNPNVHTPSVLKNTGQREAELTEDYGVLRRSMAEYPEEIVAEAVRVLESDTLGRSEKGLELAKWALDLHRRTAGVYGTRRDNLFWLAVAVAPPGWAHLRNTVVGTLLEDLKSGKDFASVKRRWEEKTHGLQYQRPTALTEGNLERAEKVVAALGVTRSLDRRFARLTDLEPLGPWLWKPVVRLERGEAAPGAVFGHLRDKVKRPSVPTNLKLPPKTVTWEKFVKDVLPTADKLEFMVPHGRAAFYGMTWQAHDDAPPVLQWDGLTGTTLNDVGVEYRRNPAAWYFYHGGSYGTDWGLKYGTWVEVRAVTEKPCHWQRPHQFQQHGKGAFLILAGARDVRAKSGGTGGGLFPECLRGELREIRAAVEAHARSAQVTGWEGGDCNGYALSAGEKFTDCRLRATGGTGATAEFTIDRWE